MAVKIKNVALVNAVSSLALQVIITISGFLIPRLILSAYGSEVNGLISSLNQFLNYVNLIEGGITGVILANMYGPFRNKDKDKMNSIMSATISIFKKLTIIFAVYAVALAFSYPLFIQSSFDYDFVVTLSLILSIKVFLQYCFALSWRIMLRADKKVYVINFFQIISVILEIVLTVVFIRIAPDVRLIKILAALAFAIQPLSFEIYSKRKYKLNTKVEPDKKVLAERWDGFGINIAGFVHNNTDVVILSIVSGLKQVSVFAVYRLVVNGLKQLIQAMSTGLTPSLGHAYNSKNRKKLDYVFGSYEILTFFATFFLFTVGGILITPFAQTYTMGITDVDYYQPLLGWIMILSEAAFCLREPYVNLAYSANKYKDIKKIAYIEAGLNLAISLVLVWKIGLIGVAIGTLVAMIYRTVKQVLYLKEHILKKSMKSFWIHFVRYSIASALTIWITSTFFSFSEVSLRNFLIYSAECLIVAGVVFLAISGIFYKREMLKIIQHIRGRDDEK